MKTALTETLQKLPLLVEQTATRLNKKVKLHLKHPKVTLDSQALFLLNDILIQLIRNAIDHGIKKTGNIYLDVKVEPKKLTFEIRDDGIGIDLPKVLKKAQEAGFDIPKNPIDVIFSPGFSTKPTTDELSGRGIGLDVVKTNTEKLNGKVSVQTELGKGTIFTIILPLRG